MQLSCQIQADAMVGPVDGMQGMQVCQFLPLLFISLIFLFSLSPFHFCCTNFSVSLTLFPHLSVPALLSFLSLSYISLPIPLSPLIFLLIFISAARPSNLS